MDDNKSTQVIMLLYLREQKVFHVRYLLYNSDI